MTPAQLAMALRAAPYTKPVTKPAVRLVDAKGETFTEETRAALVQACAEKLAAIYGVAPQFPEGQGCMTLDEHTRAVFRAAVETSKVEIAALVQCRTPSSAATKGTGKCDGARKAHPDRGYRQGTFALAARW